MSNITSLNECSRFINTPSLTEYSRSINIKRNENKFSIIASDKLQKISKLIKNILFMARCLFTGITTNKKTLSKRKTTVLFNNNLKAQQAKNDLLNKNTRKTRQAYRKAVKEEKKKALRMGKNYKNGVILGKNLVAPVVNKTLQKIDQQLKDTFADKETTVETATNNTIALPKISDETKRQAGLVVGGLTAAGVIALGGPVAITALTAGLAAKRIVDLSSNEINRQIQEIEDVANKVTDVFDKNTFVPGIVKTSCEETKKLVETTLPKVQGIAKEAIQKTLKESVFGLLPVTPSFDENKVSEKKETTNVKEKGKINLNLKDIACSKVKKSIKEAIKKKSDKINKNLDTNRERIVEEVKHASDKGARVGSYIGTAATVGMFGAGLISTGGIPLTLMGMYAAGTVIGATVGAYMETGKQLNESKHKELSPQEDVVVNEYKRLKRGVKDGLLEEIDQNSCEGIKTTIKNEIATKSSVAKTILDYTWSYFQ